MDIQQTIQLIGHALGNADVPGVVSVDVRSDDSGYYTVYFATMDDEGRRVWKLDDQGLEEIVPDPLTVITPAPY